MDIAKQGFMVHEFCKATGLGESKVYELLTAGLIEAVKCGSRTLIITTPSTFLADLPRMVPAFPLATSKRLKTIAVMGSLAGYRGLPKASSYSASKAALINFVEAIRPEAVKRGINLSMINPGFVNTRLTPSYIPPILGISPDRASQYILDGLEREQMEITFPKSLSYLIRSTRHFPDDLYYKISRRFV